MGYHKTQIEKGTIGEFSKVEEEFNEFKDAHLYGNKPLEICEMADLIGAIEEYAKKFNITLVDLISFSQMTKEAFKEGKR